MSVQTEKSKKIKIHQTSMNRGFFDTFKEITRMCVCVKKKNFYKKQSNLWIL